MYQKAIITNSIILAKLCYIVHIYPLPESVTKKINKEIFEYIWGLKNNPINRNILIPTENKTTQTNRKITTKTIQTQTPSIIEILPQLLEDLKICITRRARTTNQ